MAHKKKKPPNKPIPFDATPNDIQAAKNDTLLQKTQNCMGIGIATAEQIAKGFTKYFINTVKPGVVANVEGIAKGFADAVGKINTNHPFSKLGGYVPFVLVTVRYCLSPHMLRILEKVPGVGRVVTVSWPVLTFLRWILIEKGEPYFMTMAAKSWQDHGINLDSLRNDINNLPDTAPEVTLTLPLSNFKKDTMKLIDKYYSAN